MIRALLLILALTGGASALAEPASDKSIRELMTVTRTQRTIDTVQAQLDATMDEQINRRLAGLQPTEAQKAAIQRMKAKLATLFREGPLSLASIERQYISIYGQALSEEEVQGMLQFYRTPAGQALIEKLPLLTQRLMQEMQIMMQQMEPLALAIFRDFQTEMEAAGR